MQDHASPTGSDATPTPAPDAERPDQPTPDTTAGRRAEPPKHDQGVLVGSGDIAQDTPPTRSAKMEALLDFANQSSDPRAAQTARTGAGEIAAISAAQNPADRMGIARALIEGDVPAPQVAEATGISQNTAYRLAQERSALQGEPPSPKGRPPDPRRSVALKMIEEGKSNEDIRETLNVDKDRASQWGQYHLREQRRADHSRPKDPPPDSA